MNLNFSARLTFLILLALTLIIIFTSAADLTAFGQKFRAISIYIVFISVIAFIGLFIYSYLQSGTKKQRKDITITQLNSILSQNSQLKEEVARIKQSLANPNSQTEVNISSLVKDAINDNLSHSKFMSELHLKLGNNIEIDQRVKTLNDDFKITNGRISREIQSLTRRANINLTVGTLLTISAILAISYEVLYKTVNFESLTPLLNYYIPRIATLIFVEIFAFFFLKIYKANLSDIKYYHNELTNLESKFSSAKLGMLLDKEDLVIKTILQISKTERNFIIKKDEASILFEREKSEAESDKNFITNLRDLITVK